MKVFKRKGIMRGKGMSFRKNKSNKFQNVPNKQKPQMGEDCAATKTTADWKSKE